MMSRKHILIALDTTTNYKIKHKVIPFMHFLYSFSWKRGYTNFGQAERFIGGKIGIDIGQLCSSIF